MAGSFSQTLLIGNVGNDPEIRTTEKGDKIANFSMATSESWKDKQTGEKKERTEWHRIVVFNSNLVNIIEQYVHKGSKIQVVGQNATRKWVDNNGVEKYTTEVVLKAFSGQLNLLDSKNGGGGPPPATAEDYGVQPQQQQQAALEDDLEDEIPF